MVAIQRLTFSLLDLAYYFEILGGETEWVVESVVQLPYIANLDGRCPAKPRS